MDLKDRHNIPQKNRTYGQSFKYAFKGIQTVFKEERNMRTHVVLGVAVIALCLFLGLSKVEWFWILLIIFLMLIMETWNTVTENLVDLITELTFHPIAKKAKDMAAAAVLLTAIFSMVIGAMIIVPKLISLILPLIHN